MGRQIAVVFVVLLFFGAALNLFIGRQRAISVAQATPSPSASTRPTPSPTASASPRPTYIPTPPPPAVRLSGSGPGNSRTFVLNDTQGYLYTYSLFESCQYFGELRATDNSYANTDFIQDPGPNTYTKVLPLPLSGTFYVAMSVQPGCRWSIVLNPR